MGLGYATDNPSREEVDALAGPVVVQFGTDWCGYCRAAEPSIEQELAKVPGLTRILIEDGPGRRLGRSYRVKLWPTLIFLDDGVEVARVVRPWGAADLSPGLAAFGLA